MMRNRTPIDAGKTGFFGKTLKVLTGICRGLIESLPGHLLMLTVGFILVGVVLAYLPAASSFRTQWMTDRAESAHLASLAADIAPAGVLGEEDVRQLLAGAGALVVSRVRDDMNELVLYSGPISGEIVDSDLRTTSWLMHIRDTVDTLLAPPGRALRIKAAPRGFPDEVIDVIVREAPLKTDLVEFSQSYLVYSVLIAIAIGILLYSILFFMFVRPMHTLAEAMIRFRTDPNDPTLKMVPSGSKNEIGQAEIELAQMQEDVRLALQQRERLAALGSAVANINHDLRNVLTTAQLVSDRLATDKDGRVRGMGERLVRAVDRGVRLCEATLEFGRAEEKEPVCVETAISDFLDEIAGDAMLSEGKVNWRNDVDLDLMLDVDPDFTHRIFLNLFRNSIQAMKTQDGPHELSVFAILENGFVRLEVTDTGPGVPELAQDHLFVAFSGSTRQGGTGLGLSISRELARAHGGDIRMVTTSPDGTVFSVRLPKSNEKLLG
jgi:signal transduction histidine kinase